MARRNRSSVFEDITQLIAMLPWWLGALLALISYLWLHSVASQPIATPPPGIQHMGDMVASQMWHTFATFLQYIIPISCLIGAGISAFHGYGKQQPRQNVQKSSSRSSFTPRNESFGIGDIGAHQTQAAPDCPQCGASMIKRTAKKGSHAGETFWGCASYPKCKGARVSMG